MSGRVSAAVTGSLLRIVRGGCRAPTVDTSTAIGEVVLAGPVMTAAGTAGHADELAPWGDLAVLGAHVVKSLHRDPWPGNPPPRLAPADAGMLNSVGLTGPGVAAWVDRDLPRLRRRGVRTVVSIWGRTVEEYAGAAAGLPDEGIVAVEVNLSCPNLDGGRHLFAHDPDASARVVDAVRATVRLPVWAKLSPNTDRIVEVAGAVREAGASAVTLVNTLLGLAIDPATGRARLGAGTGGLSGPALRPVAVRAVHAVRAAHGPGLPVIGVGGVSRGVHAAELLAAGASAVQVGTATFVDPRAPWRVQRELVAWCARRGVRAVADLVGSAHA